MRVWMVTKMGVPHGVFLTEAEARMHVMMRWPNPEEHRHILVFEWDETMDFYGTMDAADGGEREGFDADGGMF